MSQDDFKPRMTDPWDSLNIRRTFIKNEGSFGTEPVYPAIDALHINNREMCASCHFPTCELREYHIPDAGKDNDTWWVCDACVGTKLAIRVYGWKEREILEAQCWLANYVIRGSAQKTTVWLAMKSERPDLYSALAAVFWSESVAEAWIARKKGQEAVRYWIESQVVND